MLYLCLMDLIKMGKLNNYIPKSIKNIRLINREIEDCIKKEYLNILNKNNLLGNGWVVHYIKEIVKQNIIKFIRMKLIKGQKVLFNCNYKKIVNGGSDRDITFIGHRRLNAAGGNVIPTPACFPPYHIVPASKKKHGVFLKLKKDNLYLYTNIFGPINVKFDNILEAYCNMRYPFKFTFTFIFEFTNYDFIANIEKKNIAKKYYQNIKIN